MSVLTTFQQLLILAGIGLVGLISFNVLKRKRLRNLPDICDREFIETFRKMFPQSEKEPLLDDGTILVERDNVAKVFSISPKKVSPAHAIDSITTKYGDFYGVAAGDLENELLFLFKDAGIKKPYPKPVNIGELILHISSAKKVRRDIGLQKPS
jgi:hypothetical protein